MKANYTKITRTPKGMTTNWEGIASNAESKAPKKVGTSVSAYRRERSQIIASPAAMAHLATAKAEAAKASMAKRDRPSETDAFRVRILKSGEVSAQLVTGGKLGKATRMSDRLAVKMGIIYGPLPASPVAPGGV